MDDDDDKLLVVDKESPATDKLSRVLNWLGFLIALGIIAWAVVYVLG